MAPGLIALRYLIHQLCHDDVYVGFSLGLYIDAHAVLGARWAYECSRARPPHSEDVHHVLQHFRLFELSLVPVGDKAMLVLDSNTLDLRRYVLIQLVEHHCTVVLVSEDGLNHQ